MTSERTPEDGEPTFHRLIPNRSDATVDGILSDWFEATRESTGRSRLAVNFATTADGAISLADGVSGGIGDDGDLALFRGLRDRADAVMAGTATIAAEGYGRLIRDADRRSARTGRGLAADPLAVIVSRSGNLPLEAPIFGEPEQRIAAFVPPDVGFPDVGAQLEITHLDPVDPLMALQVLGAQGVRSVVCEGGPTIVSSLAAAGLIDDLFLTIAPKLAGGGHTGLVDGAPLDVPSQLELAHVAEREGSLFIHWRGPVGQA